MGEPEPPSAWALEFTLSPSNKHLEHPHVPDTTMPLGSLVSEAFSLASQP